MSASTLPGYERLNGIVVAGPFPTSVSTTIPDVVLRDPLKLCQLKQLTRLLRDLYYLDFLVFPAHKVISLQLSTPPAINSPGLDPLPSSEECYFTFSEHRRRSARYQAAAYLGEDRAALLAMALYLE